MQPAQDRLATHLAALRFNDPDMPVIANFDANSKITGKDSRTALVNQVTGAVQWLGCIRKLIDAGARTFIEVGPGKVLTGLMRQIDRSQTAQNVEDESSLQKVMNSVAAPTKE
jgi:[acyl-carrier-protein] S-malonyltransferase